jgi:hypothetical protein
LASPIAGDQEEQRMKAYEFYRIDPKKESQIFGVLTERRKNPERITQTSIMNWGEKLVGKELDTKDIFVTQVTIEENH